MEKLGKREIALLKQLDTGLVEGECGFPGIGAGTIRGVIAKGWIEEDYDPVYGRSGYSLTKAGVEVLDWVHSKGL